MRVSSHHERFENKQHEKCAQRTKSCCAPIHGFGSGCYVELVRRSDAMVMCCVFYLKHSWSLFDSNELH